MNRVFESIREVYVFMLLLALNMRILTSLTMGEEMIVFRVLAIIFAFLAFDYKSLTKEFLCVTLLILILGLIGDSLYLVNVLTLLLVIQAAYFISTKTYLLYNIIILGASSIIMYFIYGEGFSPFEELGMFDRDRKEFGFTLPNTAALYYYGFVISLLLYLSISKYKKWLFPLGGIFCFLLVKYIYSVTDTRGFFLSLLIFIIVFVYYSIRKLISPKYVIGFSKYILIAIPFVFFFLSIYLGVKADGYPLLDFALSGRLGYYYDLFRAVTFSDFIFGTPHLHLADAIIDSSYLQLLFQIGIVFCIYFFVLYYFAIKNMILQQNFLVIAIIVSFLSYGLMESLLIFPVMIGNNLFFVLIFKYRFSPDEAFDTDISRKKYAEVVSDNEIK